MTDLLTPIETKPRQDVGKGNALFLADLANGASAATLRANAKAGKYEGLSNKLAADNLKFWGMS